MKLPWKQYVEVYLPVFALLALNGVLITASAIYASGFREGQNRLLRASALSANEVRNG